MFITLIEALKGGLTRGKIFLPSKGLGQNFAEDPILTNFRF